MSPTAQALRHAQDLDDLLDRFPPSTSPRDRRMRAVLRLASAALREGRPLAEVADDAAQEVYGFCLVPDDADDGLEPL